MGGWGVKLLKSTKNSPFGSYGPVKKSYITLQCIGRSFEPVLQKSIVVENLTLNSKDLEVDY